MSDPIDDEVPEEESLQQPAAERRPQEPAQHITIQTPLDRPEFDWFIEEYMKRLGLTDRKEAAISLTQMFYGMGLDPYADLKEVQASMHQLNDMLQTLPNTPQSMRVKDTLSAAYSVEAGKQMLNRLPKTSGQDPFQDRLEKLMDRYLPMILAMNMMKGMMSGDMPQQQQKQQQPAAFEMPPEYKAQMEAIQAQLATTQNMLQAQQEEKRQKEHDDLIISSMHETFAPQIDAINQQISALAQNVQAVAEIKTKDPEPTDAMKDITRELTELRAALSSKQEAKSLSLGDVETVIGAIESIEKRIKKEAPAGEFDWKTATMSTISEIGKEAIGAFRDIQQSRPVAPQYQQPPLPAGTPQQPPATHQKNDKQIAVQKLQSYIMQNLKNNIQQIVMEDATKALGLTPQQILEAYNELKAAGWITDKQPAVAPQTQAAQASITPTQAPTPAPAQTRNNQPVASTPAGAAIENRFDANSPFLER
jgi:phage host-nuclease inhibitor protein Gam